MKSLNYNKANLHNFAWKNTKKNIAPNLWTNCSIFLFKRSETEF